MVYSFNFLSFACPLSFPLPLFTFKSSSYILFLISQTLSSLLFSSPLCIYTFFFFCPVLLFPTLHEAKSMRHPQWLIFTLLFFLSRISLLHFCSSEVFPLFISPPSSQLSAIIVDHFIFFTSQRHYSFPLHLLSVFLDSICASMYISFRWLFSRVFMASRFIIFSLWISFPVPLYLYETVKFTLKVGMERAACCCTECCMSDWTNAWSLICWDVGSCLLQRLHCGNFVVKRKWDWWNFFFFFWMGGER